MKFAHENDFDVEVNAAALTWNVSPALVKAVIAAESEFNPRAYRAEPQIGDASYGLMQLLYRTATTLGYTGSSAGLYDPQTNIRLGVRFLSDLIKNARYKGYGIDSAVSAYNAGGSAVRPGDGKRLTNLPGSEFINQPYVDKVMSLANYYARNATAGAHELTPVTITADLPAKISAWTIALFAFPFVLPLILKRRK